MLETLTMRASSLACSSGRKARVMRTTASKLIAISQSKSSAAVCSKVPPTATPALLTRRSTRPCAARTASGSAATAARSVTSMRLQPAWTPTTRPRRRPASPSASMSTSESWQPRRASATAIARPMPPPAPVTTATLPRRLTAALPAAPKRQARRRRCGRTAHHQHVARGSSGGAATACACPCFGNRSSARCT